MPTASFFAGFMIAGALLMAPVNSAFAGHDERTYEHRNSSRNYIRERERKVRRQEQGYRKSERRRLAKRYRRHDGYGPWGPFYGPPGLF
jgi:hypothetical protein